MIARHDTHWCDWDAYGRVKVRALCGAYIRRREHAQRPTCPDCQRVLAERRHADAVLEAAGKLDPF
jgi:hypothetical protein